MRAPRAPRALRILIAVLALAAPLVPASPASSAVSQNWYNYHADALHSGYSASTPAPTTPKVVWRANLDGVVQASPLVVDSFVFAATEHNTVYGLSRRTGQVVWARHLGAPVPRSALPCGNIDPLGITGTPVYERLDNRVWVVATTLVGRTLRHTLYGIHASDGAVVTRTVVDPPNQDPNVLNQRGALNYAQGRIVITYGGHAGDCGNYHGYLVSVPLNGVGPRYYRTGTQGEAGMWQPAGAAIDSRGYAYAVTGNGRATSGSWDGGNSVQTINIFNTTLHDYFVESTWAQGNRDDTDLGSSGALVFGDRIWIQGKTSTGYVLNRFALGRIGHPLQTVQNACAQQFGGGAVMGSVLILPCTDGIRQLLVNSDHTVRLGWKAASNITGSPVIGGGFAWTLDTSAGVLDGLNLRTGARRFSVSVGPVVRFATPALSASMLFVPTKTGITAVGGV
jgi:outer membrane protein assembly factor BamB